MTAKQTMIKKYIKQGMSQDQAEEAYIIWMSEIASKGGKASRGMYLRGKPELARKIASKGGSRSKRGMKYLYDKDGKAFYRGIEDNIIYEYPL